MATKDQERKALDQIKKIVNGLGEESYIRWAFDGCFEIAESNIENDFANSPKEAIAQLRKNYEAALEAQKKAETEAEENKEDVTEWIRRYNDVSNDRCKWKEECRKRTEEQTEQAAKIADLEQQIICLKAKLYDMITAAE